MIAASDSVRLSKLKDRFEDRFLTSPFGLTIFGFSSSKFCFSSSNNSSDGILVSGSRGFITFTNREGSFIVCFFFRGAIESSQPTSVFATI